MSPSSSNVRDRDFDSVLRVEDVIRRVRHERLPAGIVEVITASRGGQAAFGIHPLNECRSRQGIATIRSDERTDCFQAHPRNCGCLDDGGCGRARPYTAGVCGVLPRHPDAIPLDRIGTGEVRNQLIAAIAEQRRLRRKQGPGDAAESGCRLALVVLRTDSVSDEEYFVWRQYLETGRDGGRRDRLGIGCSRRHQRESQGKSHGAAEAMQTPQNRPSSCVAVLHEVPCCCAARMQTRLPTPNLGVDANIPGCEGCERCRRRCTRDDGCVSMVSWLYASCALLELRSMSLISESIEVTRPAAY